MRDGLVKGVCRHFEFPKVPSSTKIVRRGCRGHRRGGIAKETPMRSEDRRVSFMSESSQWMQAGFIQDAC